MHGTPPRTSCVNPPPSLPQLLWDSRLQPPSGRPCDPSVAASPQRNNHFCGERHLPRRSVSATHHRRAMPSSLSTTSPHPCTTSHHWVCWGQMRQPWHSCQEHL